MATLPPNVKAGTSTAVIFNDAGAPVVSGAGPTFTLADLTGASINPQNAIDASVGENSPLRVQFPSDLPPYFIKMSIGAYQRSSWAEIGSITSQATVVLPMPIQILDRQTTSYATEPLHIVGGLTMGMMAGDTGALGSGWDIAKGVAQSTVVANAGQVGQALLAASGRAINDFLTVMLKGPTYKKWTFTWKLSPKTPGETQTLIRLRKLLSDAQAPGLPKTLGSAFFTFPKVFQLSFEHIGGSNLDNQLFKFKKAVLEDMAFNFTPSNVPSFYAQTLAPESVEISMSFLALEYYLAGDYGSGLPVEEASGGFSQALQDAGQKVIDLFKQAGNSNILPNPYVVDPAQSKSQPDNNPYGWLK